MNQFNYSGLHHVAYATSDMDMTIEYWRDLLGFKMVLSMGDTLEKQYAFSISDQMLIFFFEWKDVKPVLPKRHGQPVKGPFIFDHMAIHMESLKDLELLQDQLVGADMPVTDIIDHGFLYSIYTYDPNGIPLEFTTLQSRTNLFHSPMLKDTTPSKIAEEGSEPIPGKWPPPDEDDDLRIVIPGYGQEHFK